MSEKHKCDNCARVMKLNELNKPKDLAERLDDDSDSIPSGECPGCGALCYPLPEPFFPKATKESPNGWVIDYNYLRSIKEAIEGDRRSFTPVPSLEQIEEVIIAVDNKLKAKRQ